MLYLKLFSSVSCFVFFFSCSTLKITEKEDFSINVIQSYIKYKKIRIEVEISNLTNQDMCIPRSEIFQGFNPESPWKLIVVDSNECALKKYDYFFIISPSPLSKYDFYTIPPNKSQKMTLSFKQEDFVFDLNSTCETLLQIEYYVEQKPEDINFPVGKVISSPFLLSIKP